MKWLLFVTSILLYVSSLTAEELPEGYKLSPLDRIQVKAMRFDRSIAAYIPWEGINGEYQVSANGILSIPFAENVVAGGETTETLGAELAIRLQRESGEAMKPRLVIEVIDHLPVYVLGAVRAPGAYKYHPGLTVQQAIALAGGEEQVTSDPYRDSVAQVIGDIRLLSNQIVDLKIDRDRIISDLSLHGGGAGYAFFSDAPDDESLPTQPDGLSREILNATLANRSAVEERIKYLQNVTEKQIEKISEQITLLDTQLKSRRSELDDASQLKERGLVVRSRVEALSSSISNLQAQRIQLEIAQLNAEQQLNRAQRDELELADSARSSNLQRLEQVEREIDNLTIRLETAKSLFGQALETTAQLDSTKSSFENTVEYRVSRDSENLLLLPDDDLNPGDTLKVIFVLPPEAKAEPNY